MIGLSRRYAVKHLCAIHTWTSFCFLRESINHTSPGSPTVVAASCNCWFITRRQTPSALTEISSVLFFHTFLRLRWPEFTQKLSTMLAGITGWRKATKTTSERALGFDHRTSALNNFSRQVAGCGRPLSSSLTASQIARLDRDRRCLHDVLEGALYDTLLEGGATFKTLLRQDGAR